MRCEAGAAASGRACRLKSGGSMAAIFSTRDHNAELAPAREIERRQD
jgi:hypothetical protein